MQNFDVKRLALAGGILWGSCVFLGTLLSLYTGYGQNFSQALESIYPFYHVTLMGSIAGLVDGFIDGFVGLFVIGWLYNVLG